MNARVQRFQTRLAMTIENDLPLKAIEVGDLWSVSDRAGMYEDEEINHRRGVVWHSYRLFPPCDREPRSIAADFVRQWRSPPPNNLPPLSPPAVSHNRITHDPQAFIIPLITFS